MREKKKVTINKKKPNWLNIFIVLLLLSIPLQTITSMKNKSIYGDEPYKLASGYSKWVKYDYRLSPEHGPVQPMISTFPLIFLNLDFPFDDESWEIKNMNRLMPLFLLEYNNNIDQILFWSRVPMILLSIILAFYVYLWAKELFGKKAGVLALFLYAFSTDMLAHAQISSNDFGLAVFSFIAVYYFWKHTKEQDKKSLVVAGIWFALAQLTKTSAIFMLPVYGVIIISLTFSNFKLKKEIKLWRKIRDKRIRKFLLGCISILGILFVTYIVIICAYKFEGMFKPIATSMREDVHLNKDLFPIESFTEINPIIGFVMENVPSPLPYYFVRGTGIHFTLSNEAKPSLVVGDHLESEWYFFVYAFLVKSQIPLLILLVLSILFFRRKNVGPDEIFLIAPFVMFHIVFMFTTKQYGYRYLIHTLPFLFVFVSRVSAINLSREKLFNLIKIGLIVWYVVSSISIFPHYLAYFNEFVGPENGYKVMVNTNTDWGQDLYYLRDYIEENNISEIKLSYYGFPITVKHPLPKFYKINYSELGCGPTEGVIAISVTNLMANQECHGWLLDYEPEAKLGYTIFVYDIKTESLNIVS